MNFDFNYWTQYPTLTIPNFILSILMWTFFGRFILDIIIPSSDNYIKRFFHNLTNPIINIFNPIIPRWLHPLFILLYIPFLLMLLRFLLFVIHFQMGIQIIPDEIP